MIHLIGLNGGPLCQTKDYDIAVGLFLFQRQDDESKCKECVLALTQEVREDLESDIARRKALDGQDQFGI